MKKLFFLIMFLYQFVAFAQNNWVKSSPSGNGWQNVGNAGFSLGEAGWISLALNPSSQPYVAFRDGTTIDKLTVMKFDGFNWLNVGIGVFQQEELMAQALLLVHRGNPMLFITMGKIPEKPPL